MTDRRSERVEVQAARKAQDDVRQKVKGNPHVIAYLDALDRRLRAVERVLHLDHDNPNA